MAVRRILAVLAAAVMVVAALVVRSHLDSSDSSSSPPPGTGTGTGTNPPAQGGSAVCATELAAACEALTASDPRWQAIVEPAGTTADRLIAGDAAPTLWITLAPWPAIVDGERTRKGQAAPFGSRVATLANTRLALVGRSDRIAAAKTRCRDLGWKCLGDLAGQSWADLGQSSTWGQVRFGLADAASSASGLLVLGQATAGFFGRADVTSTDIDASDDFPDWLAQLIRSVPKLTSDAGSPLDQFLLLPATYSFVASLEQDAAGKLSGARGQGTTIAYPAPMAAASAVMAGAVDRAPTSRLTAALTASGWRSGPADAAAAGALPSAATLTALRLQWKSTAR